MKILASLGRFESKRLSPEELIADYAMKQKQHVFNRLYAQLADDLYHYLLSLSDRDIAEDIAQKTWLKIYEKPQRYQGKAGFKAWLFTVARNALFDEFRKLNRMQQISDELLIKSAIQSKELESTDIHERFEHALLALPFTQREAFCLQQEGFSLEQIADISGAAKETIKTRLRYARHFLKQRLEASDE